MRRIAGYDGKLAGFNDFVEGNKFVFADNWIKEIQDYGKPQHNDKQLKGALFVENFIDCCRLQRK